MRPSWWERSPSRSRRHTPTLWMAAARAWTGSTDRAISVATWTPVSLDARTYSRFSQQVNPRAAATMATVMPVPLELGLRPGDGSLSSLCASSSSSLSSSSRKSGCSTIQYAKYLHSSSERAATTNALRNMEITPNPMSSCFESIPISSKNKKVNRRNNPGQMDVTTDTSSSTTNAVDVDRTKPDAKHLTTASSDTSKRCHLQWTK
mmetsp:Transcript_12885/g.25793  ORF Transcript_12885/g.25793 Transcript_12885/m.25793 type:complete len:206 (-) Transcript_12885:1149-1766(-)